MGTSFLLSLGTKCKRSESVEAWYKRYALTQVLGNLSSGVSVFERRTITARKFSTFCPNFRANRLYKGGKDTKQWRIQGRGPGGRGVPPPLFLNQTGARRAEKFFLGDQAPHVSKALDDRFPPALSQGLDPALLSDTNLLAPRHTKREKASLPVAVRSSKMPPLKLTTISL